MIDKTRSQGPRTKRAAHLSQGVSTVDTEIRARDVLGGIAKKEGYSAHQVLRGSHFSNGNEGGPLIAELGVLVEDLTGTVVKEEMNALATDTLQLLQRSHRETLTVQSTCNPG